METFATGLRMILDKADAKVINASPFTLPLELLSKMAKNLLTKEEAFDIFMSMLEEYHAVRRHAWEMCKTADDFLTFNSMIPRNEFGKDTLAEAIGMTALQFLDDYFSLNAIDFPKYDKMRQLIWKISTIGVPPISF